MLKSMTGYGRREDYILGKTCLLEIRTLNHRYLDINMKVPKTLSALEDRIRGLIKNYISRGRVDVYFKVKGEIDSANNVKIDRAMAESYYTKLKGLAEDLNLVFDVGINSISQLPGVIEIEEEECDLEEFWIEVKSLLLDGLEDVIEMRLNEGSALVNDLKNRLEKIEGIIKELENKNPDIVIEYKEKLEARVNDLLEKQVISDERLEIEVALMADKSCITEETVRIGSHLKQFLDLLDSDEAVGRKLDFLVQEMHREVNTIGSKSSDSSVSCIVVELKSELEKIKEQVQNIE